MFIIKLMKLKLIKIKINMIIKFIIWSIDLSTKSINLFYSNLINPIYLNQSSPIQSNLIQSNLIYLIQSNLI